MIYKGVEIRWLSGSGTYSAINPLTGNGIRKNTKDAIISCIDLCEWQIGRWPSDLDRAINEGTINSDWYSIIRKEK